MKTCVCVCVHQSEGKRERVVWGKKETYREWLVMNYGYYFNRTLVSADIFLEFKYHLRSSLRRLYFKR